MKQRKGMTTFAFVIAAIAVVVAAAAVTAQTLTADSVPTQVDVVPVAPFIEAKWELGPNGTAEQPFAVFPAQVTTITKCVAVCDDNDDIGAVTARVFGPEFFACELDATSPGVAAQCVSNGNDPGEEVNFPCGPRGSDVCELSLDGDGIVACTFVPGVQAGVCADQCTGVDFSDDACKTCLLSECNFEPVDDEFLEIAPSVNDFCRDTVDFFDPEFHEKRDDGSKEIFVFTEGSVSWLGREGGGHGILWCLLLIFGVLFIYLSMGKGELELNCFNL